MKTYKVELIPAKGALCIELPEEKTIWNGKPYKHRPRSGYYLTRKQAEKALIREMKEYGKGCRIIPFNKPW